MVKMKVFKTAWWCSEKKLCPFNQSTGVQAPILANIYAAEVLMSKIIDSTSFSNCSVDEPVEGKRKGNQYYLTFNYHISFCKTDIIHSVSIGNLMLTCS